MDYKKIKDRKFSFIYLYRNDCSVCGAIFPRIKEMAKAYEEADFYEIDLDKDEKAAGEFLVFSIPALIVFSEGKELLREARFFNLQDIKKRLDRYYSLIEF